MGGDGIVNVSGHCCTKVQDVLLKVLPSSLFFCATPNPTATGAAATGAASSLTTSLLLLGLSLAAVHVWARHWHTLTVYQERKKTTALFFFFNQYPNVIIYVCCCIQIIKCILSCLCVDSMCSLTPQGGVKEQHMRFVSRHLGLKYLQVRICFFVYLFFSKYSLSWGQFLLQNYWWDSLK